MLRSRLTGLYMVELGKRRKLLVQPGQHLPPPSWAGCECQKGCWTLPLSRGLHRKPWLDPRSSPGGLPAAPPGPSPSTPPGVLSSQNA